MNNTKTIDLSNNKMIQKKRDYDLNDKRIMSIQLEKNVKVCLLENEKGQYVDFRKYYNDFPTKKGIRIEVHTFKDIIESLKEELDKIK